MTFILKLIVALPLLAMVLFLTLLFEDRPRSVDDLKIEQIEYSEAYIDTYGISTRYRKIAIDTKEKTYSLYPDGDFIPEGMTLDSVAEQLSRTSEATVWVEEHKGLHIVRGIQTQYLNIPPSRGIKYLSDSRKRGWLYVAGCVAISVLVYLYFKRHFGLDWKLNFKV